MRFLTLAETLELHRAIIETTGGTHGLRDLNALEAALCQPYTSFDEQERVILDTAAGKLTRDDFIDWVRRHTENAGKSEEV